MADGLNPDKAEQIKLEDFSLWFTINNSGADTGKECKVVKYDIVATQDAGALPVSNDPIINYTDDTINVVVNQVPLEGKSYYLRA